MFPLPHVSFCLRFFFFFGRLYLSLNLPCFCFFPEPGPPPSVSHKAISSSVLRCIYYRGLAQTSTRRRRVKVTCLLCCPCRLPHTPWTHSLILCCLWGCFIMSSYMHIIEACPTQAACLRWNIWIIYRLQFALPHFRKFPPRQSRKIIHAICILQREGWKNRAKAEEEQTCTQ